MPPFSREEEVAIEAACREHHATHLCRDICVLNVGPYLVKYGEPTTLASYIRTRSYLYDAQPQSHKPRIHQLLHHFDNGQGRAFAVLEVIKLVDSPRTPPDLDKRILDAVTWLAGVPAPPDHKLGPVGGPFRHHLFLIDGKAPLPFVSVEALEQYVEKGRRRLWKQGQGVDPIKLTGERLICVHAGMDDTSHFGVDETGNTVMTGLGHVSFLPETLGLAVAANMLSMAKVAYILGMTADITLGLNKYGNRRKTTPGTLPCLMTAEPHRRQADHGRLGFLQREHLPC
ncbi:hypothetical protein BKA70DRAFT_1287870 [Coprinopsis sp. MPI-PUGE-AT-0042]|nr:hypothetical protein BKA70DRAFT_1287870 [Coprinopsis sp. MPI-PUGE-AT-0042]